MRFTIFALAPVVAAHFTLNYPPTRGFDDDNEVKPICGGFTTIKNRTAFPLSGGKVEISSFHTLASVFGEISFNSDPSSFTQFNTTSSGVGYPQLIPPNQIPEGDACWNVDISALNVSDAKDGANATLVIIFDGGDGTLYQCADLVLESNATTPSSAVPSNVTCQTLAITTGTGTSPASPTKTNGALRFEFPVFAFGFGLAAMGVALSG